jgi:hypothetical protein
MQHVSALLMFQLAKLQIPNYPEIYFKSQIQAAKGTKMSPTQSNTTTTTPFPPI